MGECESCGATLDEGAKFCGECGMPVASDSQVMRCESCGATLDEGAKFCGECGTIAGAPSVQSPTPIASGDTYSSCGDKVLNGSGPSQQYRHIYDFDVAGSHLPERQKAVLAVSPPQSAELRPEPNNPYDAKAVAVYVGDEQLGYVPASQASAIATFLDRGELVEARVASTHWTEEAGKNLAAAHLFIGIGIPDPGVEPVHHVVDVAAAVVNEPGGSGTENVVGAGEKMQQVGSQMQKAGLNMTACGCSVAILVVIGFTCPSPSLRFP